MTYFTVFVLGDVGRSPRMQYHAMSLADLPNCKQVDVVGLGGVGIHPNLLKNIKVEAHLISDKWWSWMPRWGPFFLLFAPLKVFVQSLLILYTLLFSIRKMDCLLVQTPPAIPTLPIVHIIRIFRRCQLVIDWHNYGYTLLQLPRTLEIIIKSFAKSIEKTFGRGAQFNFCVSEGMRKDLLENWSIHAITLYDRPPSFFKPLSIEEIHNLFYEKLKRKEFTEQIMLFGKDDESSCSDPKKKTNSGTSLSDAKIVTRWCDDRPFIIISSTSWTPDEDFGLLLKAIEILEASTTSFSKKQKPIFQFFITGNGPQKAYYLKKIQEMKFSRCRVDCLWLEHEDYPKLLACSDLGICLHSSSSGLDLPMKIVDMFGVGLPVLALHYDTLSELVEYEQNGLFFETPEQLAKNISMMFEKSQNENKVNLKKMRKNLEENFQKRRWADEWKAKAQPVFC